MAMEEKPTLIGFAMAENDLKEAFWQLYKRVLRRCVVGAVLALIFLIAAAVGNVDVLGIVLGSAALAFFVVYPSVRWAKIAAEIKRRGSQQYEIRFDAEKMTLRTASEESVYRNDDVRYLCKNKAFIYLQPAGQALLILPNTYESDLATAAIARETTVERAIMQQRRKPLYTIGILLAVLSFVAVVVSLIIALIKGETYIFGIAGVGRYLWVALCFLPLPAAVVAFAFVLRQDPRRFASLLTAAVLSAAILYAMGSVPLRAKDAYTRANVAVVEQRTGLVFPADLDVACSKGTTLKEINALVAEKDRETFEAQLKNAPEWTDKLPEQLQKYAPLWLQAQWEKYSQVTCYNETKGGFNVETDVGDKLIYVCYSSNGALYIIYDYTAPNLPPPQAE